MGEILGLGMTHYPPLAGRDENMSGILRGTLRDPAIPSHLKEPENWPKRMQQEWGTDQGKAKAAEHRNALLSGLQKIRAAIGWEPKIEFDETLQSVIEYERALEPQLA